MADATTLSPAEFAARLTTDPEAVIAYASTPLGEKDLWRDTAAINRHYEQVAAATPLNELGDLYRQQAEVIVALEALRDQGVDRREAAQYAASQIRERRRELVGAGPRGGADAPEPVAGSPMSADVAEMQAVNDDEALAKAYLEFMDPGPPPEPTTGYNEGGWWVDANGVAWGICNGSCGEERLAGSPPCCPDGEVVPTQWYMEGDPDFVEAVEVDPFY